MVACYKVVPTGPNYGNLSVEVEMKSEKAVGGEWVRVSGGVTHPQIPDGTLSYVILNTHVRNRGIVGRLRK